MAEILYSIESTVSPGALSPQDLSKVSSLELLAEFNPVSDFAEASVYDSTNTFLYTTPVNVGINAPSAPKDPNQSNEARDKVSTNVYINPEDIVFRVEPTSLTGTTAVCSFFRNIFRGIDVEEISYDRTELKVKLTSILRPTLQISQLIDLISNSAYYGKVGIAHLEGKYTPIINIVAEEEYLYFKLYNSLPDNIEIGEPLVIIQEIADPVSIAYVYQPDAPEIPTIPYLRSANFDLDLDDRSTVTTEYLNYNDLYNLPVTNSYNRIFSELEGSGVGINVDYTDFSNFVHFSSAKERLANFRYKLNLIHQYEQEKAEVSSLSNAGIAVTSSNSYYDTLIKNIVSKFDGYERFLYYESSSYTWPKSNSTKPYLNISSSLVAATTWYNGTYASASLYDELNESNLEYTVPEFIRQDSNNAPYTLFLNMIGQHFDELWVYSNAVTEKYNADNRIDYGISKDLIVKTLQNFGVKLYSSNFAANNLASLYLGEWFNTGSEAITSFVTASNEPTPDREILTETYKRIYHNLPYLLKTKGTERGLRALINCFGVPSSSLSINTFGGVSRNVSPYFAYDIPATQKVKLDYTGSIVPGSTLSQYTSIVKPDEKYNQDLNIIEIGFSPTYYIDNYILSRLPGSYMNPPDYASPYWDFAAYVESGDLDIDQYIGDPRYADNQNYTSLEDVNLKQQTEYILSGSEAYNMFDFVRLVKFFDNQLFKMIKDFAPARDVVTTGVIIKPHVLNRSKIKSPSIELTQPEYSASIDTAFLTGSDGGIVNTYSTAHTASILSPLGIITKTQTTEVEKYTGELGGTLLDLYTGSLNELNPFKSINQPEISYNLTEYLDGDGISETNYLYGYPNSPGNMSIFWGTSKGGGNYVQYIKIHFSPATGSVNLQNSFRAGLTSLIVNGTTYTPESVTVGSSAALLRMPTSTALLASFDPAAFPRTSTVKVIALPYVIERFDNSDYNALLNNATTVDTATNLQKVDYSTNPYVPVNIDAIRNNTAEKADVQEYLHNSAGMVRGRYGGEQLRGVAINVYTPGDVTYGTDPVIENQTAYFSYFNKITNTSPVLRDSMTADIRYLIDQNGTLLDIQSESTEYYDLLQTFAGGATSKVSLNNVLVDGVNMTTVNGNKQIVRAGARVEPILYSHTGSEGGNYTGSLTFGNDPTVPDFRGRHLLSTAQSPAYVEDDAGYVILFDDEAFQGSDLTYSSGEFTFGVAPTFAIDFTVTFNIDSTDNKTWFDVSEDVNPIVEYFSGSNWYQLQHSIVSLGGSSRLPNSSNPYTVRINTESSDNIIKIKAVSRFRSSGLAINLKVGDKIRTRIFCKEGNLEVNRGTSIEINQAVLPLVKVTKGLFGYWISLGNPGFDTTNGASYLVANAGFSTALSNAYGLVQTPEAEGYPSCSLPFTVEVGDEIRFRNSELYTHKVIDVIKPDEVATLTSLSGVTRAVSGSLLLKIDPPLLNSLTGSEHVNSFLLRRYVEDPKSVILRGTVPGSATGAGILTPEYMTPATKLVLKKVVPDLKSATN